MCAGDLTAGGRLARQARRDSWLAALVLLVLLVGCAACGSSEPAGGVAPGSAGRPAPAAGPSRAPAPSADPDGPSVSALQVCSPDDGQKDIAAALGVTPKLGKLAPLDGIGETAFYTREGSIVARKDFKVLLVDVSGLPATFGDPPAPRASISHIIAAVIMGCWSGA